MNTLNDAVKRVLEIYQIDVKTAFLTGKIQEDIYIEQPNGFVEGDFVRTLNNSRFRITD